MPRAYQWRVPQYKGTITTPEVKGTPPAPRQGAVVGAPWGEGIVLSWGGWSGNELGDMHVLTLGGASSESEAARGALGREIVSSMLVSANLSSGYATMEGSIGARSAKLICGLLTVVVLITVGVCADKLMR